MNARSMAVAVLACTVTSGCFQMDTSGAGSNDSGANAAAMYQVHGVMQDSSCGPGAFGSTDVWDFEVSMWRTGKKLYWNNGGDTIEGSVASDNTFSMTAQVQLPVDGSAKGRAACILVRDDSARGTLAGAQNEITTFTGQLTYAFSAQGGAECATAVASEGILSLPCSMTYRIAGTKQ